MSGSAGGEVFPVRLIALTPGLAQLKMPRFIRPSLMKIEKSTGAASPRGLFFTGLLAVVLAVLFVKSFLPGYVHFSNDGPLGQQNAAWRELPAAFTGTWYDINDLGSSAGAMAPAPSALIFGRSDRLATRNFWRPSRCSF